MAEYNFIIAYQPGRDNVVADLLSRMKYEEIPVNDYNEWQQPTSVEEFSDRIFPVEDVTYSTRDPLQHTPVPAFPSQTRRNASAVEDYTGRYLRLPAIWLSVPWARSQGLLKKTLVMKVVGKRGNAENQIIKFLISPAFDTDHTSILEEYEMSPTAAKYYLISNDDEIVTSTDVLPSSENQLKLLQTTHKDTSTTQLLEDNVIENPTSKASVASQQNLIFTNPTHVSFPQAEEIHVAQQADPNFKVWWDWIKSGIKPKNCDIQYSWWKQDKGCISVNELGLLVRTITIKRPLRMETAHQVLIPQSLQERFLLLFHAGLEGQHLSLRRCFDNMRHSCFWPHMKHDLLQYIKGCRCAINKDKSMQDSSNMGHLQATLPNELVCIDCYGPLPKSHAGHTHVLAMQDYFSKWLVAVPIPQPSAVVITSILWSNWITAFSPMKRLLSDNGT